MNDGDDERVMRLTMWFKLTLWHSCLVIMALLFGSITTHAADFSQCREQFLQKNPPQIHNAALSRNIYPLCFEGFAVQYSGISRTPLWSAEFLTPQRIRQAKRLKRQDNFHEESRIPLSARALLSDYKRSGYDRGHMAPNGDMATLGQQQDSFSLANMVPQSPHNNQDVWRNLEEATRVLVTRSHRGAYVITGPAFLSASLKQVGKVLVPSHVYKAVYIPELNLAGAYFAPNDDSGEVEVISVARLEQTIGINLFPALEASVKTRQVALPLNAQAASQFLKGSLSAAPIPEKAPAGPHGNRPAYPHSTPPSSAPPTGWLDYLKQQLVAFLVAMLNGK